MERRILIAFILSFAVLSLWSSVFSPHKSKELSKVTETIVNKEDGVIPARTVSALSNKKVESLNDNVQTEIKILENSKIRAEFSNKGGNLIKLTEKEYIVTLPVIEHCVVAVMARTVHFYHQILLFTEKIRDKTPNRLLPAKLEAG